MSSERVWVIALLIEVKGSTKQSVDISTLAPQEIIVTNDVDDQTISIDQTSSQIIDIDTIPLENIEVKQDGININITTNEVPNYEGEYIVTPKVTEQTLPTAQTLLERDVTIEKIPYFEVSNISGGMTASIGV